MEQVFELLLAADDPAGVRDARRATTRVVASWAGRPGVVDDACLVVSELVTNALRHGRSDAVLRLLHQDSCIRVEVLDEDTRLPVLLPPDPRALSGRGLALVAALATLWGAEPSAAGKTVWAELDISDRRED